MRICSIASGSSGNCIYVGDEHTHVLVDTGISKKRIEEGLKDLDVKGVELDGILLPTSMRIIFKGWVYSAENTGSHLCYKGHHRGNQRLPESWKDAGGTSARDPCRRAFYFKGADSMSVSDFPRRK